MLFVPCSEPGLTAHQPFLRYSKCQNTRAARTTLTISRVSARNSTLIDRVALRHTTLESISTRHRKKTEIRGRQPPTRSPFHGSGFVVYRVSAFLVSQPRETFDSIRPDGISISYRGHRSFQTLENTVLRMYTRNPFDLRFHANKDTTVCRRRRRRRRRQRRFL